MSRKPILRGYVLVDTLVAVSIAALAAGMALQLMAWAVRETTTANALTERTRVLQLLYERARTSSPGQLDDTQRGQIGQVRWSREVDPDYPAPLASVRPRRIIFRLSVPALRKGGEEIIEAIIWPVGPEHVR